jgi:phage gpG-like protein
MIVQTVWNESTKEKIGDAITAGIALSLEPVFKSAVTKCPVDTGRLKSSIQKQAEGKEGIVYSDVNYAEFVEFMNGKPKAANATIPFLRPALYDNKDTVVKVMANAMRAGLR